MLGISSLLAAGACSSSSHQFNDAEPIGGADAAGGKVANPGGSSAASSGTGNSANGGTDNGGSANGGSTNGGSGTNGEGGTGGDETGDCEPGKTEPCYESPTGTPYGDVPPEAVGNCKIGLRICSSQSSWGACQGAVPAASADTCVAGDDASCNGIPNEGCPCLAGESRACGVDTGECQKGVQGCVNLEWGPCVGEVAPQATDTCEEGNDANCDGTPNAGCACINGDTKACGISTGNCTEGQSTCVNGVWGSCVGGVQPKANDSCDPAGDDANCNGVANEGCACTAGSTRACDKCGTQTCTSQGTWPTTCAGAGACEVGDVRTDTVACGNCGSQARRSTCSAQCAWGAWENVGGCLGSGPCQPGVTAPETRTIGCGNCNSGTQAQTRACTAQCDWPATWTNVGSCTGQGCTPGSVKAEASVSCGYCNGTQARESTCSQSCVYGAPTNKGACQQASCSTMPGDERVGYVTCFNDWPDFQAPVCTAAQKCCMTTQGSYNCATNCQTTDKVAVCDGPEDCGGSNCCIVFDVATQTSYSQCTAGACNTSLRCHADSDCTNGLICRKNYSSASGAYNGRCGS